MALPAGDAAAPLAPSTRAAVFRTAGRARKHAQSFRASENLMRAMILAGGLSTRLYPLTKQVPKPLVPVVGAPNAVHLIRYLASYGFDEIAINVHYLAGMIVEALGDGSAYGARLQYLHEKELLGSAGAVKQMQEFLSGGSFVVVGCDDLTDMPLDRVVAFHKEKG